MTERPILFSGPMVRAILDGRKTQTRRVVNLKHVHDIDDTGTPMIQVNGLWRNALCPCGQAGDRLWVREAFQPLWSKDAVACGNADYETGHGYNVLYPASEAPVEWYDMRNERLTTACKPSIHMPRWACRILLEITGVRVERLQEISDDDAEAEGIERRWTCLNPGTGSYAHANDVHDDFRSLWDSLATPGFTWAENPWVWVVEFKRLEGQS
ncbi:MAG: hypothetical protein ACLGSA_12720 [Acidobacteriota bacterium]